MEVFTANNASQESDSHEHWSSLDAVISCSESEPLLHSETNMKITGGIYTERYGITRTECADEWPEQKKPKRIKNKKLRKRLGRVVRTSWKWLKRGFAGYSLSANWMFGFAINPNDIYRSAYDKS